MHVETERFLQALFDNCQPHAEGTCLTLTAIHPDGVHPTPSCHVPLGNRAALERALDRLLVANRHGWGGYVGIAARRGGLGRWTRGGKEDLVALPALFVDMDDPGCALWHLTFFDLAPSIIVQSGRGYHAYWLFKTPTRDFHLADRALKGLAQALGGDGVLSVAQSMRLPGTVNTKPGREGILCSLVQFEPEQRYSLTEFARYCSDPSPAVSPHYHRVHESFPLSTMLAPTIDAVTNAVIHELDGRPRHNGFIAARCPLPHHIDRPGMHFSYHPDSGVGFCFGKHGKLRLRDMCQIMGVRDVRP
ncbi:MAG TPA: DNA-primase RepB domain-containing protein [Aggregatilineales bacterium]|nr:DNA-primase RepB domain-containing protein [Aggregatilineales bacterium]